MRPPIPTIVCIAACLVMAAAAAVALPAQDLATPRPIDGIEGDVNLEGELWGEVFEPLKDVTVFRRFHLDAELNTVT